MSEEPFLTSDHWTDSASAARAAKNGAVERHYYEEAAIYAIAESKHVSSADSVQESHNLLLEAQIYATLHLAKTIKNTATPQ